jgi:hypothetical protein
LLVAKRACWSSIWPHLAVENCDLCVRKRQWHCSLGWRVAGWWGLLALGHSSGLGSRGWEGLQSGDLGAQCAVFCLEGGEAGFCSLAARCSLWVVHHVHHAGSSLVEPAAIESLLSKSRPSVGL